MRQGGGCRGRGVLREEGRKLNAFYDELLLLQHYFSKQKVSKNRLIILKLINTNYKSVAVEKVETQ